MTGINDALGRLLAGYAPHNMSLPKVKRTPDAERVKVLLSPVRVAVNRQAALIIKPVRDWTAQPPPMPPEKLITPEQAEIARLAAIIKTERNCHALTRDALGQSRQETNSVRRELKALEREAERLRAIIEQQNGTIRQLEDLKL